MLAHAEETQHELQRQANAQEQLWRQCQALRADKGQLQDRCDLLEIEGEKLRALLQDGLLTLTLTLTQTLTLPLPLPLTLTLSVVLHAPGLPP